MILDQPVLTTRALSGNSNLSIPLAAVNHCNGLEQLHKAFDEPQPLVVLAGSSATETRQLISSFLSGIRSDVTVVRIDATCSGILEGMREVVQTTGFDPQGRSLIDLDILFMKFLSLQRVQHYRTIFVIEETPDNEAWVRDKVRDLVQLDEAGNFGLMVLLSRQSEAQESSVEQSLSKEDAPPKSEPEADLPEWNLRMDSDATVPLKKIPRHNGKRVRDLKLEQPRLMIGRAADNDLCLRGTKVSRHHAILVRHGAAAVVMDLNSTNGTYVNSRRIKDQVVVHDDIIEIGNHHIRFVAANGQQCGAISQGSGPNAVKGHFPTVR